MPPRTPLICCFSELAHGRRLRQHGDFQRGLQVPAAQREQEAARPGPLQVCPRRGPSREAPPASWCRTWVEPCHLCSWPHGDQTSWPVTTELLLDFAPRCGSLVSKPFRQRPSGPPGGSPQLPSEAAVGGQVSTAASGAPSAGQAWHAGHPGGGGPGSLCRCAHTHVCIAVCMCMHVCVCCVHLCCACVCMCVRAWMHFAHLCCVFVHVCLCASVPCICVCMCARVCMWQGTCAACAVHGELRNQHLTRKGEGGPQKRSLCPGPRQQHEQGGDQPVPRALGPSTLTCRYHGI